MECDTMFHHFWGLRGDLFLFEGYQLRRNVICVDSILCSLLIVPLHFITYGQSPLPQSFNPFLPVHSLPSLLICVIQRHGRDRRSARNHGWWNCSYDWEKSRKSAGRFGPSSESCSQSSYMHHILNVIEKRGCKTFKYCIFNIVTMYKEYCDCMFTQYIVAIMYMTPSVRVIRPSSVCNNKRILDLPELKRHLKYR